MALAFAVAGLPCLLLLILGWRMLAQEREIRASREQKRHIERVQQVSHRLLARLRRVRRELAAGVEPEPRPQLVALRAGSTIRFPWEPESSDLFADWPATQSIRERIQAGKRKELVLHDAAGAASEYRRAMEANGDAAEKAYAGLLMARALESSGRKKEAMAEYRRLAKLGPRIRDDQRVPIAFYALERLAEKGAGPLVASQLSTQLPPEAALGPTALHLALDVAKAIDEPGLAAEVNDRLRKVERALDLRRDLSTVLPTSEDQPDFTGWVAYGDWLWLVGSAVEKGRPAVVAVGSEDLVRSLIADDPSLRGLQLTHAWAPGAEQAGPALLGLGIRLPKLTPNEDGASATRRVFLLADLVFVLVISLVAAWLLLRDVKRESELAELRSQFVASVSHELKTPLSSIRMFAESLKMGRPSSAERRSEYLETIVNESERLSRLLDNVLEMSKIERGERRYHFEPHDPGEVVREALKGAEYPLRQQGFHLRVTVEEDLPPIRVDRDALEQALLNLLTNAMKYSGESRAIEVEVEGDEGIVAVRVVDHGVGISPQDAKKIFAKFYRAPNSDGVAGAGLGLAIVSHIAEGHGGNVSVESEPGSGSTFTMTFPREGR